jgi:hypothetical protein
MNYLKNLGPASVLAIALVMTAAAGTASATTLEVGGKTKNESVSILASLEPFSSTSFSRTDGSLANTCTSSNFNPETESPFTGTSIEANLFLSFGQCERPIVVHLAGRFRVSHASGTTNGKLTLEEAKITVGSSFGTLVCETYFGTNVGTLTGVSTGNATIDINAVMDCGFLNSSVIWKGTYRVGLPGGLGVSA